MKKIIGIIFVAFLSVVSTKAQVQTIVITTNAVATNSFYQGQTLNISSNSVATCKSIFGPVALQISTQGASFFYDASRINLTSYPIVIAGPATIQIQQSTSYSPAGGFASFSVEPGPFPPGKAVTVGAYSGNVQVTMQMSTDLVNWTAATNGMVYTNTPDARFFRIQLVTNASP
jgi:hypothetical protein